MKTPVKYLIAIGLVFITYVMPYLINLLIIGLGESDDDGLVSGLIWLAVFVMSIIFSFISFLTNKYNSIFSIYSCILGLSFSCFFNS
jgi:hypothetical protein